MLVSAGESSGDLYASSVVQALRAFWPETEFFGCAGPRMQAAGVRPVVDARSLAVVGLVEVVAHLPRIYGEYRRLMAEAAALKPDLAILTDSPDFHLRAARRLKRQGVPVAYLVAPQVWAWRKGRLAAMRRSIDRLLCIFPFEEPFFRRHGLAADYIGHPLTQLVRPRLTKEEFFRKHRIPASRPVIALCPGSRRGEIARHLPPLLDAVAEIYASRAATFLLAAPFGFSSSPSDAFFRERIPGSPIQVIEGETWDALAHADVALTASGTVTVEAALLGTPMVAFYRVTHLSWLLGRLLVRVPHYTMVNLVAGRPVVPELMQNEMTGPRLAGETMRLLDSEEARETMRAALAAAGRSLVRDGDPMERAARLIREMFDEKTA